MHRIVVYVSDDLRFNVLLRLTGLHDWLRLMSFKQYGLIYLSISLEHGRSLNMDW